MTEGLYARDGQAIAGLQKLRFFPLAIAGGRGARLMEENGRELIDFSGAWGAASLGYGHPALVEAVSRAVANPAGASVLSAANAPATALAEKLLSLFPGKGRNKVWFGHSGSDANEAVFRAIAKATGRTGVISFVGAYHGCTTGSMAFSGHSVQAGAAKAEGLILLPYPDPYRPYQGDVTGDAILDLLKQRFATTATPEQIGCAFIEPIQSDGGLIVPPEGFFKKFADLCRQHGILVVCDEVKVGLGRSGRMHCFEHEDFVPDILTIGKGLGGGLPLSAAIGPAEIMDCATAFAMQTLHGNPVSTAAGLAVLETIDREGLVGTAHRKGERLREGLRHLSGRHALIGDVRGRGLASGVELIADRNSRAPAARETAKLIYRAYELGLVVYYVGMNANVLEMTPPLTISDTDIDRALDILDRALGDVAAGRVSDAVLADFAGW
ncbi:MULTISPECIES: aspartate aminotransferase family protein [unclassified Ensifer]|uniref:aspartate aminotransferase family protein n=1 Tax=unclassified Ensifer TaxID=2633371 RepID=UPI000812F944|nr:MULTISPECIES: aspartate aminotransferase family protein [unclassified Ensifer]OCP22076.1 aminotransferase [Ensifer sp. LC384]OCP26938.1 aminotransferase [Ensifer sp. LC54]